MVTARASRARLRTPHAAPGLAVSESAFQIAVMDLARLCGWRAVHIRTVAARTHGGAVRHLTPYDGDPGLPDLVLARAGVVLLIELKSETGRVSPEQRLWLAAADGNGRLWRPSDWPAIRETLRRPA